MLITLLYCNLSLVLSSAGLSSLLCHNLSSAFFSATTWEMLSYYLCRVQPEPVLSSSNTWTELSPIRNPGWSTTELQASSLSYISDLWTVSLRSFCTDIALYILWIRTLHASEVQKSCTELRSPLLSYKRLSLCHRSLSLSVRHRRRLPRHRLYQMINFLTLWPMEWSLSTKEC